MAEACYSSLGECGLLGNVDKRVERRHACFPLSNRAAAPLSCSQIVCLLPSLLHRIVCCLPSLLAGQHFTIRIIDNLNNVLQTRPNVKINTQWVLGHTEVAGNETVDRCAKSAAGLLGRCPDSSTFHAYIKRQIQEVSLREWQQIWTGSRQPRTKKFLRRPPSAHPMRGTPSSPSSLYVPSFRPRSAMRYGPLHWRLTWRYEFAQSEFRA